MSAALRTHTIQGVSVPQLFYGTAWKEARTLELTRAALSAGFIAIDTANQRKHYAEALVGEAVAAELGQSFQRREELFLQTKFTYLDSQDERLPYDRHADVETQVRQSFESSLSHLQTTYVDAYLLHGPSSNTGLSDSDRRAWRTFESLHAAGKTKLIGVSNVSLSQLELLCDYARIKPAFVQNRCYARTGWDRKVRQFCERHGIGYQGFSLLTANQRALELPAIARICARLGASTPEVVFAFASKVGMLPLTGTSKLEHMRKDLRAVALDLLPQEVEIIENVAARSQS